jgi:hypothetical protein
MPLEIKELHIRVTVNQPAPSAPAAPGANVASSSDDNDALIRQCIEQVVDLIHTKGER